MRKGGMGVLSLDVWIWKQEAGSRKLRLLSRQSLVAAARKLRLSGVTWPGNGGPTTSRTPRGLSIVRFVCILLIDCQSGEARGYPHASWRKPRHSVYMILCRGRYRISCIISYRFWPSSYFKWYIT